MRRSMTLAALTIALVGCGSNDRTRPASANTTPSAPVTTAPQGADRPFRVLFLGNSHTRHHDVPATVGALLRAATPTRPVELVTAPGSMFLSERVAHGPSVRLLRERWDVVVLQAQKYSASGRFRYSTAEAEELVRRVRGSGALPLLFPEWSRRDIPETDDILAVHLAIADAAQACVAPVPQAFDIALDRTPALVLHDPDGNHSSPAGAHLAALVLAGTIHRHVPAGDDWTIAGPVPTGVQRRLRAAATLALRTAPPAPGCPDDADGG